MHLKMTESSFLRPIGIMFSGGLFGKLLGVVREVLFAAGFGTSSIAGAYRVAQTATFIPVDFFTANTLNAAFLPLYARYRHEDPAKAETLFWSMATIVGVLSILIAVVLSVFASCAARLIAPGLQSDTIEIAARFIKITALGAPFYILCNLLSYLEMANNGYVLTSMRAGVQNFGIIGGLLLALFSGSPLYIAWGFTSAYIMFSLYASQHLIRKKILHFPTDSLFIHAQAVTLRFGKTLLPLVLLPFFLQANIASERIVASLIGLTAVSALDYAKFITETGVLLLAVPVGLVGLSRLSGITPQELDFQLRKIVPVLLIITVPLSVFLLIHGSLVVQMLYARGNFDASSVAVTSDILRGLSMGFWAQVCGYVLIKVLNAQLRNLLVVRIMIVALIANILVNFTCYRLMGAIVLGIGTGVCGFVQLVFCAWILKICSITLHTLAWLSLGCLFYWPLGVLTTGDSWLSLLIAGSAWFIFWGIFIWAIPSLRSSLNSPFMNR